MLRHSGVYMPRKGRSKRHICPERGGGILTLIGLQVKIRDVACGQTGQVVVVSSDAVGTLPIRLVVPLTEWNDHFTANLLHVKLLPDRANGLSKTSAVDALQLRGVNESTRKMSHKPIDIKAKRRSQLIEYIDEGRFAIPKLQREFVWDGPKAAKLFDSMFTPHMPIGVWSATWATPQPAMVSAAEVPCPTAVQCTQ